MDAPPAETEPSGSAGPCAGRSRPADDAPVYTAAFWIAYVANVSVVAANALTFRFAELVDFLGGKEQTAGLVVGVATAVSLLARVRLGQAIDRYGVRRLWLASSVLFVAGGAALAAIESLSWTLYAARSLFAVGLAGMVTCSTVHIQNLVPPHRRTEVIGSLGSSGFVGIILGTLLGDGLFHGLDGRWKFVALFGASTLLGLWYVGLVLVLTRGDRHVPPADTPALHRLVARYWPGNVMLVAFAMGLVFAVTTVFLTRFATHRGLTGLGPFFAAYSVSAFGFRMLSRSWSRTVGRHRMILLGLAGHTVAMLLLPFVRAEWQFALPAAFGGFAHALLFPAVVSLGSEAFPQEYRGTGTTLVMGFFDVGMFVSAPVLGGIIDAFDREGFPQMFAAAAVVAVGVAVVYQLTSARRPDSDLLIRPATARRRSAAGSFARRWFAPTWFARRLSPAEPFAREGVAAGRSAREESASGISVREGMAAGISAREGTTAGSSASEGSAIGHSAREGIGSGRSAREGTVVPSRTDDRPADRAAASATTRCR